MTKKFDPNQHIAKLAKEALAIEAEDAKKAGSLGYLARMMVLATMPHSKPEGIIFERSNGKFHLAMVADPRFGLPYGAQARLLLAWVTTQIVKTRSPVVELGPTMSSFMKELDITPTGGKKGTIVQFKHHAQRLFTTSVTCTFSGEGGWSDVRWPIARATQLWWEPTDFEAKVKSSRVRLSDLFFHELVAHPIPLDLRALGALRKSPLAMDIYSWLTYRFYRLNKPIVIRWEELMKQFGSNYSNKRQFRQNFLKQLRKVLVVYPQANVDEQPKVGLKLMPSPTHITTIH